MQRSAFYIRSGIGPIQATTHAAPSFAREDCVGGRRPEVIGVGGGGGRGGAGGGGESRGRAGGEKWGREVVVSREREAAGFPGIKNGRG